MNFPKINSAIYIGEDQDVYGFQSIHSFLGGYSKVIIRNMGPFNSQHCSQYLEMPENVNRLAPQANRQIRMYPSQFQCCLCVFPSYFMHLKVPFLQTAGICPAVL